MIVPVMAISNLVLTQQIYSEETNGAHAHYREPVPLILRQENIWNPAIFSNPARGSGQKSSRMLITFFRPEAPSRPAHRDTQGWGLSQGGACHRLYQLPTSSKYGNRVPDMRTGDNQLRWRFFIFRKIWTKNPLMMLKVLDWPLIISPSDQFTAANVVLVVTFQFLFCFFAQVATKNRVSFFVVLADFTQNKTKQKTTTTTKTKTK